MKSRHKLVAALIATLLAALVTGTGTWAFMVSIHDPATYLKITIAIAFPVASLLSRFDFFRSDLIYWALLFVGVVLWLVVGYYLAITHLRRYPDVGTV